ncbi:hypothetical protein [Embleya sp. NPDC059237]|uniref:hypothetical protein n=1 Tax=Embleya sp. NPDC059237 TaxID=3346784 RepID=UPI0036B1CC38
MTSTPAARRSALDRLAAAAATRDETARDLAAAGTIDERRACRGALRAAAILLHASMVDAQRHGVPTAEIAVTARATVRSVAAVLRRERDLTRPIPGRERMSGQRTLTLGAVVDAVLAYGTAHPTTHAAIRTAHRHGASPTALATLAGISTARLSAILLAAGTDRRP